ncbi:MAG TPA: phospholipid carrier-dependent glycosyltransferase, partial [Blastocatellia bacterium]|nr:phospholipid carrier-dependent glycosyltransferase [Blastocatellia bacterium]
MGEIGFALSHYGAAAVLALLAYQFGRRLTSRLNYHSALEEFSLSAALGLGAIAYLIMFLSLAGLLYRPVIAVALAAGSAACYQVWIDLFRRLKSALDRLRSASRIHIVFWAAVIIAVFALSIPILQMPLYPPTAFDSTFYHLPAAKAYAQNHGLVFTPYLRYAVFPQTPHMLFTLALIFYDDVLAHLVMFLSLLILLCAVIAFGRRYFSARAGWWAAALITGNALVLQVASIAYVDMLLILFVMTAVYAFWNWTQERDEKWIAIAGALCGLAITVKYSAGFFLLLLGLVAAYRGFRDRSLRPGLILWLSALIVAFPWLARNFYYTRNPVYPFFYEVFTGVFGYGYMRPEYYVGFFEDISAYGIGKSIQSLIALPWHMTFGHASFLTDKPLAPYLLFALPVLITCVFRNKHIRRLAILTFAFTLFWFFTIQVDRYWMPALPFLNLAIMASLDELLNWNRAVHKYTSHAVTVCLVIMFVARPGWSYAVKTTHEAGPIPINREQMDNYLARNLPSYSAYKLLNEKGKPSYTIYAIQDENLNYYANGKQI